MGSTGNREFEDEMGVSRLDGKNSQEKANIMKNCFPYSGESSLSDYQKNVEYKLLSDIRVKEIQEAWTEKLNNANRKFLIQKNKEMLYKNN